MVNSGPQTRGQSLTHKIMVTVALPVFLDQCTQSSMHHPSTHPFIYASIQPSTHLSSIHTPIHPSIYTYIYPHTINAFIYTFIVDVSIYNAYIHLPTCLSVCLPLSITPLNHHLSESVLYCILPLVLQVKVCILRAELIVMVTHKPGTVLHGAKETEPGPHFLGT